MPDRTYEDFLHWLRMEQSQNRHTDFALTQHQISLLVDYFGIESDNPLKDGKFSIDDDDIEGRYVIDIVRVFENR